MRRLSLCLLVLVVAMGCGKRATVNQTYTEGESPLGEREETYGRDVSLQSPEEADLAQAETLVRQQEFAPAARILERLVQQASGEVREEALYELGELQGHLLNPDKDYVQAKATLRKLIVEYPDSEFRVRAEQAIARIENFQKDPAGQ